MARLIDGKVRAQNVHRELAKEIVQLEAETRRRPGLAVIQIGNDPASTIYVRNKKKACAAVGIISFGIDLPADATLKKLLKVIADLNRDSKVHGILCQLPLPDHLPVRQVLDAIRPEKDVDGFHPINIGRLVQGCPGFVSCTPAGILDLIHTVRSDLTGLRAVVVGRSNIVGKPVAHLLLRENCTVTIAHSKSEGLPDLCREADILVAATGSPELITDEHVRPGQIVIDVGIHRFPDGRLVGDVAFDRVEPIVEAITPVPGAGPMTIAFCLRIQSWLDEQGIDKHECQYSVIGA